MKNNRFLLVLILLVRFANAQSLQVDSISKVADIQPYPSRIFVRTDKTVFYPDENILFAAYDLSIGKATPSDTVLNILLIRAEDKKVIDQEKHLFIGGFSSGSFKLPDSIPPGDYQFWAFSWINRDFKPADFYCQPIRIIAPKSAKPQAPVDTILATSVKSGPILHAYPENSIIQMRQSVVDDTLTCVISGKANRDLIVAIHDFHQIFLALPFQTNPQGRTLKVAVTDMPAGLLTMTVLTTDYHSLAQRLFFAHYNKITVVNTAANKPAYGLRQQVTVHLKLPAQLADSAVVSISCVRKSRLPADLPSNMLNYYYLGYQITSLTAENNFSFNKSTSRQELEKLLYDYDAISNAKLSTSASRSAPTPFTTAITGTVLYKNEPVRKNIDLLLIAGAAMHPIKTDNNGRFIINKSDLLIQPGEKVRLWVAGARNADYHIQVNDPFEYAGLNFKPMDIHYPIAKPASYYSDEPVMATALKEVTVKSRQMADNTSISKLPTQNRNACGDYICAAGALNCPLEGHLWRTYAPVKGHQYIKHVISNGRIVANTPVTYDGCAIDTEKLNQIFLTGIETDEEFYPLDAKSSEPLYQTTLYWNPYVKIYGDKTTDISFNTGDLPGEFVVTIQGISNNGVTGGQTIINVVR